MELYYYDGTEVHPDPWREYQRQPATLPSGTTIAPVVRAPAHDLYPSTRDATPAPSIYHTPGTPVLVFEGERGAASGLVRVQPTYLPISLDALLERKRAELGEQFNRVFFSAFPMTAGGGARFWVNANQRARAYRTDVDAYFQWNAPPPWRNVPVWLIRDDNGAELRTKVDEDDWRELKSAQGRFSFESGDAADAVAELLEAAYDAGDWSALAGVDVTADPPGNAWPEHRVGLFA